MTTFNNNMNIKHLKFELNCVIIVYDYVHASMNISELCKMTTSEGIQPGSWTSLKCISLFNCISKT